MSLVSLLSLDLLANQEYSLSRAFICSNNSELLASDKIKLSAAKVAVTRSVTYVMVKGCRKRIEAVV